MRIYLDLVFFINFMFDLLLLLTVKIVLKRRVEWYRMLFGSSIGALSIFLLFFELNSGSLFILKVIISILMTYVSFGYKNKYDYFKNLLYLYFISIILGGFVYYLNIEFSYQSVGLVFFHNGFSINLILLFILSPIILYIYIKQNRDLRNVSSCYYEVDIYYDNNIYSYRAYLDTGNKLYDPYFHKPIILLYDLNFPTINKVFYIPYKTLEHEGLLECFKVEKMVLDKDITINKPIIALSKEPFNIAGVEVLLHKDYL